MPGRLSKAVLAVLVALLVEAPLVASVCQLCCGPSDTTCPVCHFIQQPMEQPLADIRLPSIQAARETEAPQRISAPVVRDAPTLASRAPPSA